MIITFDSEQNGVHFWSLCYFFKAVPKWDFLNTNSSPITTMAYGFSISGPSSRVRFYHKQNLSKKAHALAGKSVVLALMKVHCASSCRRHTRYCALPP